MCVYETGSRTAELSPQGSPTLGHHSSTTEDIWVLRKPLAGEKAKLESNRKKNLHFLLCCCSFIMRSPLQVESAAAAWGVSAVSDPRAAYRALETRMC